jgi:hypothetical protein
MPTPQIRDLEDGHVYCLLTNCIKHFLAQGNQPMEFDQLISNYPAKSNKASKNALWVSAITVFMQSKDKDCPIGTFAVAIGPKGKSHNIVERLIGADIINMSYNAVPAVMGWDGVNTGYPCTLSAQLYMSLLVINLNKEGGMFSNLVDLCVMHGGVMLLLMHKSWM